MSQQELFPYLIDQDFIDEYKFAQNELKLLNKAKQQFVKVIQDYKILKRRYISVYKDKLISEIEYFGAIKKTDLNINECEEWLAEINFSLEEWNKRFSLLRSSMIKKMRI